MKLTNHLIKDMQIHILKMTTYAQSGHPGGSLSTLPLIVAAYHRNKKVNPSFNQVIISNGHVSPALYAWKIESKNLDPSIFYNGFRNCEFEGHITRDIKNNILWSSGCLGQGLSAACGYALYKKYNHQKGKVICITGDGELQKGQINEAYRFACKNKLKNLVILVDYNKKQITGDLILDGGLPLSGENIYHVVYSKKKGILEYIKNIQSTIRKSQSLPLPKIIYCEAPMGLGVDFMEHKEKYHGKPLTMDELYNAIHYIGDTCKNKHTQYLVGSDITIEMSQRKSYIPDIQNNKFSKEKISDIYIPLSFWVTKENINSPKDMRKMLDKLLLDIAKNTNNNKNTTNVYLFDCDLAGSVGLGSMLKQRKFKSARLIRSGIMEHHTCTMAGAISTIPGNLSIWCDFGVFGLDEVYNQLRMIDLTPDTNLKLFLTHTGLNVGEDGKSHHCIDYFNLLNNLKSFQVYIPLDSIQLKVIINKVLKSNSNTVVILPRRTSVSLKDYISRNPNLIMNTSFVSFYPSPKSSFILMCTSHTFEECITIKEKFKNICDVSIIGITKFGEYSGLKNYFIKEKFQAQPVYGIFDHYKNSILDYHLEKMFTQLNSELSSQLIYTSIGINQPSLSASKDRLYNLNNLSSSKIILEVLKTEFNRKEKNVYKN